MLQVSTSSKAGHSSPPAIGTVFTLRFLLRKPADWSVVLQVLEHWLHADQEETSQSLGITQERKFMLVPTWSQRLEMKEKCIW